MQPWKLSESHHDWRGLRVMRDESYARTRKAFPAQFVVGIGSLQSLDRELSLQPVEQLRRCGVQRSEAFRVGYVTGVGFIGRPFDSPPVSAHVIAPRRGYRRSPS